MWFVITALSGLVAVAAGAASAHLSLSEELGEKARIGVQYQFYHTLALFMVAWMASRVRSPLVQLSGAAFLLGILCFCGSLYAMARTGNRALATVTPYGGVAFMVGWLLLAICGAIWSKRLRATDAPPAPSRTARHS